jgi:hypothetical protein
LTTLSLVSALPTLTATSARRSPAIRGTLSSRASPHSKASALRAGTLRPGVDARYLLGIVRNITHEDEGTKIGAAILRTRIEARDLALSILQSSSDAITQSPLSIPEQLKVVIDRALSSDRVIDRFFWLESASRIIIGVTADAERAAHMRQATRRIHTSYRVPYGERLAAARGLIATVVPLD